MKLGIEVGGTFTDLLLVHEDGTVAATGKAFSTPHDPAEGVLRVLDQLRVDHPATGAGPLALLHGSTVATNAVLERRGPRLGFVATAGFRDILELQRQDRDAIYDLHYEKPRPLAGRDCSVEVPERTGPRGEVVQALDLDSARSTVRDLIDRGVGAIAVCLLHSYVNPSHEHRLRELVAELCPGLPTSISSDVVTEFREYERASTTTIDAFVKPAIGHYLARVEHETASRGLESVSLMQSNGGLLPASYAREHPVQLLFSGPAAGVIGAGRIAGAGGVEDLITIDMGGTSTDVCLVTNGQPAVTTDGTIDRLPIKVPMIDIVSVGAGGGSVAWLDSGGMLQVGPRSAGADPGPACYGRGGTLPTTTDANVVRGLLRPQHFLGGRVRLNEDAARSALGELGRAVGQTAEDLAEDVSVIANSTMASAIRVVSVERGRDPRGYVLVAYGGAGPLHAASVADELDMTRVLIPPYPGLLSAFGLVAATFRRDFAQTQVADLAALQPAELMTALDRLEERALAEVASQGVDLAACRVEPGIDMRYQGQGFELDVPITRAALEREGPVGLAQRFHAAHHARYGTSRPDQTVQVVTFRLSVSAGPAGQGLPAVQPEEGPAPAEQPVRLGHGQVPCAFLWRPTLRCGEQVAGPAIIEEETSTTLVPPGWTARVDETTSLLLEKDGCAPTRSH
ncbi:MAG: hydantoinase/oxoprolinase family protein [bacterium]|nr:hydantoinase/oxoprolinase family protein [bacterium]